MSIYLYTINIASTIEFVGPLYGTDDLEVQKRAEAMAAVMTGAPQVTTLLRISKKPVSHG